MLLFVPLPLPDLERGWRKTTSMLFPRFLPQVVAAEGKIFVFEYMGSESFGEVYDICGDIWEPLSPPPEDIDLWVPVLDSSRSRILVHFIIILISSVLWRRIICLIRNIYPSNGHQNFQWIHMALCIFWAMASVFSFGSTISIRVLST
ncbi:hypothetical protein Gotur_032514 [Gossypium turneri]